MGIPDKGANDGVDEEVNCLCIVNDFVLIWHIRNAVNVSKK